MSARANYQRMKGYGRKGRSRTYSAARTRSYYKQYMKPKTTSKTVVVRVPTAPRVSGETKYVDAYKDLSTINALVNNDDDWAATEINPGNQTDGAIGCLPIPRQGDGLADRDGRKIFVKWITIKGIIKVANGASAVGDYGSVRLVVIKDMQTNGVSMDAENALGPGVGADGNATLLADCATYAMTAPQGWGRYKILKDKVIRLTIPQDYYNAGVYRDGWTVPFKLKVKPNCYVNFSAAPGAIASVIDNSFHLCAASDSYGTPVVQMSYVARTAFVG